MFIYGELFQILAWGLCVGRRVDMAGIKQVGWPHTTVCGVSNTRVVGDGYRSLACSNGCVFRGNFRWQMMKEDSAPQGVRPNLETYNLLLRGCVKVSRTEMALEILKVSMIWMCCDGSPGGQSWQNLDGSSCR